MVLVGIDWSEKWHDVCLMDESGRVLGRRRIEDSAAGLTRLQALIAEHVEDPAEVAIGIETPDGLMVRALRAAGYAIYAVNPLAASRYRDRHAVSKKKSDRGDALMLADLVRTDRHKHRQLAEDSELAEAIKVLVRSHKSLIWTRQRLGNQLRSVLREFYPGALEAFGDELCEADSLALLERAPTPAQGRTLSLAKITAALRKARRHHVEQRAVAIRDALRAPQLEQPAVVAQAHGVAVADLAGLLQDVIARIDRQEKELDRSLKAHPDAEIYLSLPGLGTVLGARVLAEFGDDPNRYQDGRARKNYAGTSPITLASGRTKVVMARFVRNEWLADACQLWAFSALSASPGARRYYDSQRGRKKDHEEALRILANRLVGILHGCLRHRQPYREDIAWPPAAEAAA
ncbi:MAG TPA: IS110 family transposase [Gemmataceae bacterium]|nr:IS110 family transposase [Gemmataceae bacterium]